MLQKSLGRKIELRFNEMPNIIKKLFGTRKGDISYNMLNFIFIRLPFMVVVVLFVVLMIRGQIITEVNVQNAEMEIFGQRLIYSRNGISYYDETLQRLYPGKIKLDNFNQEYFEKNVEPSIFYDGQNNINRIIGAKLALLESSGKKIEEKEVKYNRDFYDEKIVLYRAGTPFLGGKGGVSARELNIPVIILEDNGKERSGILNIVVIMQNA